MYGYNLNFLSISMIKFIYFRKFNPFMYSEIQYKQEKMTISPKLYQNIPIKNTKT